MSDFETQRSQRLKQLEDKRKRLEEMRKQRSSEGIQKQNTESSMESNSTTTSSSVDRKNVDNLVQSLLTEKMTGLALTSETPTTSSTPIIG